MKLKCRHCKYKCNSKEVKKRTNYPFGKRSRARITAFCPMCDHPMHEDKKANKGER